MTHRRSRADSIETASRAMANARKPLLQVPAHVKLRPEDKPFWNAIIRSRARDEWSDTVLVVAAHLARVQADLERESKALEGEGVVLADHINPRFTIVERLTSRELALMRCLRLGGIVVGDLRDSGALRKAERAAREAIASMAGDDLLA